MRVPGLKIEVDTEGVVWRETRLPGVRWLLLCSEAGEEAPAGAQAGGTVLIRMEPGHGYAPHRHLGIEEVLVLAGGYRDELGSHPAGSYVRYAAGSTHAPVALGDPHRPAGDDNPACILFASARGGIAALDGEPATRATSSEGDPGGPRPGGGHASTTSNRR